MWWNQHNESRDSRHIKRWKEIWLFRGKTGCSEEKLVVQPKINTKAKKYGIYVVRKLGGGILCHHLG